MYMCIYLCICLFVCCLQIQFVTYSLPIAVPLAFFLTVLTSRVGIDIGLPPAAPSFSMRILTASSLLCVHRLVAGAI